MVDPSSESFYIARRYMLRLNKADFDDPNELAKLAATAHLPIEEFKRRFYYLIENDLMYKHMEDGNIFLAASESNVAHKPIDNNLPNGDEIDQKISPE